MKKGRMKKLLALVLCFLLIFSLVENVGYQPIAEEVLLASASDAELTEAVGSTEDTEGVEGTEGQGLSDLQESIVNGGVLGGAPIAVAQEPSEVTPIGDGDVPQPIDITSPDGWTVSDFVVKVNGQEFKDGMTVGNGDYINIDFKWAIQNGSEVTDFAVQLVGDGITLDSYPEQALVSSDGQTVGTWRIENGYIYFHIDDEFKGSDISGGANIDAYIDVKKNGDETETKRDFEVGGETVKDVTVTFPESSLTVTKSPSGKAYLGEDGKLYQKFEVTLRAWNGYVDLGAFTETPNGYDPSTITSITVTRDGQVETYPSWEAMNAALSGQRLNEDEEIKITYAIAFDNKKDAVEGKASTINTVEVEYTTDGDEKKDASNTAWNANIDQPSISKSGQLSGDRTEIEWTLTIHPGLLMGEDQDPSSFDLGSIIDSMSDKLGEYLTAQGIDPANISAENFTWDGNNFVYKYKTTIDPSILDSTFNRTLTNEFDVSFKFGEDDTLDKEVTGTVTLEGDLVDKSFESYDKGKGVFTWKVTLYIQPSGDMTNVTVTDTIQGDWHFGNAYTHVHTKNVKVGNVTVIKEGVLTPEASGIIKEFTFDNDDHTGKIVFEDSYIKSLQGKQDFIEIYFETDPDDSYLQSGTEFYNNVEVSYMYDGTAQKQDDSAEYQFLGDSLEKTGTVSDNDVSGGWEGKNHRNAIDYEIRANLSVLYSNKNAVTGDKIVLEDLLPADLKIIEDSVSVELWKDYRTHQDTASYQPWWDTNPDNNSMVVVGQNEQSVKFEFTLSSDAASWINEKIANDDGGIVYIVVYFSAEVEEEHLGEFFRSGEGEMFTNTVTGTLNETPFGEAEDETFLPPSQLVDKVGEYNLDTDSQIHYTVILNPDGADLVDGSDIIEGIDKSGRGIFLYQNPNTNIPPIEIYEYIGDDNPLKDTNEAHWTICNNAYYTYDQQNRTITFKLPDETPLKIIYKMDINLYTQSRTDNPSGSNNDKLTPENAFNDFTISGFDSMSGSHGDAWNDQVQTPNVWADGRLQSITIYKYWTNEQGQMVALNGSVFELYECEFNGKDITNSKKQLIQGDITVGDDGTVTVSGLEYDKVYALYETDAKSGYQKNEEPYYFMMLSDNKDTAKYPDGLDFWFYYGFIYYENEPSTTAEEHGTLVLTKTISGDILNSADKLNAVIESVEFSIKNSEGIEVKKIKLSDSDFTKEGGGANKWTATIDELPVGTYTVTETVTTVDGYVRSTTYTVTAQDSQNTSGTGLEATDIEIEADETTTVVFSNDYKEASLSLEAEKTLNGKTGGLQADQFEFVIEKVKDVNETTGSCTVITATAEKPYSQTVKNLANGDVKFDTINYNDGDIGTTYYYRISEKKGEETDITYDETFYIVKVTVEETGVTHTITKYVKDGAGFKKDESFNGSTISFDNKKELAASISVEASKTWLGWNGQPKTLAGNEFEFTLQQVAEDAANAGNVASGTSLTAKNDVNGKITFVIPYAEDDAANSPYYYKISEKAGSESNVNYDDSFYIVTVTVTKAEGTSGSDELTTAITKVTKYVKDETGYKKDETYVWSVGTAIDFENTTSIDDTSISFKALKVLHDGTDTPTFAAGKFNFSLQEVELKDGKYEVIQEGTTRTASNDASGNITFAGITYTEDDAGKTYYYKISEDGGSDSNIIYDDSYYIVAVTITKVAGTSGNGELQLTTTVTKYVNNGSDVFIEDASKTWTVNNMQFDNKVAVKDGSLSLEASKTLLGKNGQNVTLTAGQFSFKLQQVTVTNESTGATTDMTPGESQTKTNATNGKVVFDDITYTKADIGQTYYYKISEVIPADTNYAYDKSFYIVEVKVTENTTKNCAEATVTKVTKYVLDSDGINHTKASGSYTANNISFENKEYYAQETIMLRKTVKGVQSMAGYGNKFSFKLTGVRDDNDSSKAVDLPVAYNDAQGNVKFTLPAYTGDDIGHTYTYTITEVAGTDATFKYDSTKYYVTVRITAPNSELETEIHYYKGSTDPGNEITSSLPTVDIALPYENRLAAKGDVSIPGTKYLNDGEPGNNTFDFEIYKVVDGSSDELIDTVSSSNPDGKFAFTLSYEDEDLTGTDDERTTTYTYKVKEKKPTNGLPGYEYDENEFTVTVTLKDKGDGTISSTVSYADKSGAAREIAFYNTSTQVAWPLAAQKLFTGNTGRKAGFTFVLERTDENGTPLTGGEAYSDRKTTDASGNVVFDDQNADSVGTFYYRIYEEKPANWEDKNLVYDDTIYRIKVEVTSDDGPLVYTTSVMNADGTWGEYTTGGIKFENHIEIGINKAEKDGPFIADAGLKVTNSKGVTVKEWVSDGNSAEIIKDLTVNERYTLTETGVPYGYVKADPITFYVDTNYDLYVVGASGDTLMENGEITMYDEKATVTISKKDLTSKDELAGAKLVITTTAGTVVVDEWVTDGETNKVINVTDFAVNVVYVLTEKTAPYGYEIAENIYFKIDKDNNILVSDSPNGTFRKATDGVITMLDARKKISISKVDLTNSEELAGANLRITDESGNTVASWTSSSKESKTIEVLDHFEPGKEYTLTEVIAPDGYEVAEDIVFKLDEDGNIWIKGEDGTFTQLGSDTIVMKDAPKKAIGISKVDMTNSEELENASLIVTDSNGNEVDSWITDGSVHKILAEKFEVGEEYTLTEVTAPEGYEIAESITFKLDEDGNIWIKGEDGTFTQLGSDTIVMEDERSKTIGISKVDMTNSEELEGATLIITDSDGNEVDSWVTDGSVHRINTKKFEVDKEYTLTEITAPDGYEVAESITFKLDEDGNIWIKGEDGTFTLLDSDTIVMEDAPTGTSVEKKDPPTTTTITTTTTNTTSAKTGDHTPIAMVVILMLASAVGFIGLVVRRKR